MKRWAYYNDNDPFCCSWLRELISAGLIMDGVVDSRSIVEVSGDELDQFTRVHLFAGIGGWDYALRLAGWPVEVPVWTGSCPCQPFSVAGQGKGENDERHLFPEFARLIAECSPAVVFGEQVASKAGRQWLAGVRTTLETLGYGVGAADLCAAGVGAPHIRQRLYWVAQSSSWGWNAYQLEEPRQSNGEDRVGEATVLGRSGDDSGLAYSECQQEYQEQQGPEDAEGRRSADCTGGRCTSHWVADSSFRRNGSQRGESRQSDGQEIKDRGSSVLGGLANNNKGLQGRHSKVLRECSSEQSPWSGSALIACRDRKTRRIPTEPALFPLANGLPNRVGILRGAGNSIVPQVAAEFIQAVMEDLPS